MSLDDEKTVTEKVVIALNDGEISVDKALVEHHTVLSNMGNSDGFVYHVALDMTDFLPILTHILKASMSFPVIKKPDTFFYTCQYLGEIDLPILISKNSELIQKWALSPRVLVQCEVESMVLKMYTLMDKEGVEFAKAHETVFTDYLKDPMHHKLHEKSGRRLFPALELVDTQRLLIELTDDLLKTETSNEPEYPTLVPGNKWWKPLENNTYSIKNGLTRLGAIFENFPFKVGFSSGFFVIAGGGIVREMLENANYGFFHFSDNDIFMITRSEDEAGYMIEMVHYWVLHNPLFTDFYMTRTKNAVTFVTNEGVFQIILRLYHDVTQLLCGFDLDPSCFAYDGERILTIGRGLDCLKTNSFPLLSWKQSETMAWRCKKMRNRLFSITIPGLTPEEFNKEKANKCNSSMTILKKIIHCEGKKGSDYDDSIGQFTLKELRRAMRFGFAKHTHLVTLDLDVVFNTNNLQENDAFTFVNTMPAPEKCLTFVTEMAHGQATGSFNPTSEDFFHGIKW